MPMKGPHGTLDVLMEGDPHSIVEALLAVCSYSIGSSRLSLHRAEYPLAINRLQNNSVYVFFMRFCWNHI